MPPQQGLSSSSPPTVTVSLSDLQKDNIPISTLLDAFGPQSLGILIVRDLPAHFNTLRTRVLTHSSQLASLPPSTLQSLTRPSAKYLVGWSHGVETLRPGTLDTAKGSYYINCGFYNDDDDDGNNNNAGGVQQQQAQSDRERYPGFEEYTAPNVWPDNEDIPGFRDDCEQLIRMIIDVAVLVAKACDRFAEREIMGYQSGYLERVVRGSRTSKARLLHYFPTMPTEAAEKITNGRYGEGDTVEGGEEEEEEEKKVKQEEMDDDTWCTTHVDHGCLTGLTSAMFVDEARSTSTTTTCSDELPASPDPASGLYIRSRNGTVTKIAIPKDCLAFQTGEALELITKGKFKAVPHFVKGVDPKNVNEGMKIARNTLAVFTQPNLDEIVNADTGQTFGEFARGVVGRNTAG